TGPHEIHVTNFKILFLQGFKLFLRPDQPSRRPLFRAFLRAAQAFLERSVKRRLEPLVRKAIDTQIKTVLAYLNRQAELRPKPRLPPELFAGVAEGIFIGGPSRPGAGPGGLGGPGGVGPGVGPGGPLSAGGWLPSRRALKRRWRGGWSTQASLLEVRWAPQDQETGLDLNYPQVANRPDFPAR
ncbi:hypothetical protein MTO96_046402, partial [Rhipicephalus appendiculatus]